jgi:hypothetical protein
MERWYRVFRQHDDKFTELFGVKKAIFQDMLTILTAARNSLWEISCSTPYNIGGSIGRWHTLPTILGFQKYVERHDYFGRKRSEFMMGDFIYRVTQRCFPEENAGRKLAVDVMESRIECPKKQKPWYGRPVDLPKLYPIRISITQEDKPLEGAIVTLMAKDQSKYGAASGITRAC